MENLKKNPLSLQLNVEDFAPASNDEKKSLVVMRESVNFWKDGMRRLRKNKIAMVSLVVILLIAFMAYVLPSFWPYSYEQQIKGSNNLAPFEYSAAEQKLIDSGGRVQRFANKFGTATETVAAREAAKKAERAAEVEAMEAAKKADREAKAAAKAQRAAEYAKKAAAQEAAKADEEAAAKEADEAGIEAKEEAAIEEAVEANEAAEATEAPAEESAE